MKDTTPLQNKKQSLQDFQLDVYDYRAMAAARIRRLEVINSRQSHYATFYSLLDYGRAVADNAETDKIIELRLEGKL